MKETVFTKKEAANLDQIDFVSLHQTIPYVPRDARDAWDRAISGQEANEDLRVMIQYGSTSEVAYTIGKLLMKREPNEIDLTTIIRIVPELMPTAWAIFKDSQPASELVFEIFKEAGLTIALGREEVWQTLVVAKPNNETWRQVIRFCQNLGWFDYKDKAAKILIANQPTNIDLRTIVKYHAGDWSRALDKLWQADKDPEDLLIIMAEYSRTNPERYKQAFEEYLQQDPPEENLKIIEHYGLFGEAELVRRIKREQKLRQNK